MALSITRTVSDIESILSKGAMVPAFGSIPAATKVILGIIQAIGGLLAMIVATPFIFSDRGSRLFLFGASHFINGLANIVSGTLEAIPFLGTAIGGYRLTREISGSDAQQRIITGQEGMIVVGYGILESNPIGFEDIVNHRSLNEFIENRGFNPHPAHSPLIRV